MHRREFFVLSTAALAGTALRDVLGAQAAQQANAPAPVQTAFQVVRGDVGVFTGRGGTIGWLVAKDGVVVVDTQFPDTAQLCLEGLKERSGNRAIDVVLNTHHHGDHTAGNGVFQAASKRIVAHSRVPELMKKAAAGQANASAPALPTVTFETSWSETIGGETVRARHHGPAHTSGDSVIVFERANVVHMGDLLFHELHPFVDRASGASIQGWMRTLETVAKELPRDTRYIAGHARQGQPVVVGREALEGFRNYFDAVLTQVRRGIAEKKTKEEIAAATSVPGFEQYQGAGTILRLSAVLAAAYEELTA